MNVFWIGLPGPQAPRVHGRQDDDQDQGDELLRREADRVAVPKRDRLDEVVRRPRPPATKTPRNLANATATAAIVPVWTTRNIAQPNRKPNERAVGLAEEDVLPAGPGHHRRELGGSRAPR